MGAGAQLDILARFKDEASKGVKGLGGNIAGLDKSSRIASKGMQGLEKTAKIAAAAVGAAFIAAGAVVVKTAFEGVKAFADFQDGMNEVFTLLPGITADAMGKMSADVLSLSKDIGRLPEEVIPALYQSLSAGVPPDNVFEFMETAHAAALGGVTDLETAVDGISSVINTYGTDVISATQASDLMFTAVRLGKTDFQQLSNSLFNVNPVAASLGVKFGDVAAAMASMTAAGVPTRVATTQMRQLFVELSKAGGKTSETFEKLSGTTFKQFIAEGGNVADALWIMQEGAEASGVNINDLFGSVEAGAAALALAGPNLEAYRENIAAMGESAGATQAAYERMNQGMKRVWEVLQAQFKTGLIEIGAALAPFADKFAKAFSAFAEDIGPKVVETVTAIVGAIEALVSAFSTGGEDEYYGQMAAMFELFGVGSEQAVSLEQSIGNVARAFGIFFSYLQNGHGLITSLQVVIAYLAMTFGVGGMEANQLASAIGNALQKIQDFIAPIIKAVTEFVSFKDVLIVVGGILGGIVLNALIGIAAAVGPVLLIFAALVGVVALIRNVWESDFAGIRTAVEQFAEKIQALGGLGTIFEKIEYAIRGFFGALEWGSSFGDAFFNMLYGIAMALGVPQESLIKFGEKAKGFVQSLQEVGNVLSGFFGPTIERIKEAFSGLGKGVSPVGAKLKALGVVFKALLVALKPVAIIIGVVLAVAFKLLGEIVAQVMNNAGAIIGTVVDYITTQIEALTMIISGIVEFVKGVFAGDWKAAWEGIKKVFSGVVTSISGTVKAVLELLDSFAAIIFDSLANLLNIDISWDEFKESVVTAIADTGTAIKESWAETWATISEAVAGFKTAFIEKVDAVKASWENFKNSAVNIWETISTTVTEKIDALKAAWDKLTSAGDGVKTSVAGIGTSFTEFFQKLSEFSLADTLQGWWDAFSTWATGLISDVVMWGAMIIVQFLVALHEAPGKIKDKLTGWWDTFVNWVSNIDWAQLGYDIADFVINGLKFFTETIPETVKGWIDDLKASVIKIANNIAETGKEIVTNIVEGLKDFATKAAAEVATWPDKIKTWIVNTATKLFNAGVELVTNIVDGLKDFATKAAAEVATWPDKIKTWIVSTATDLFNAGVELVTNIVEGFLEFKNKVWTEIFTWPGIILGFITDTATKLFDAGVELVTNIVEGFLEFNNKVWTEIFTWPGIILGFITDTATSLFDAGVEIVTNIVEGVAEFATEVWDTVSAWPEKIAEALVDQWEAFVAIGKDIINGIIEGIKASAGEIKRVISEFFGGVEKRTKEELEETSPSRVWWRHGLAMVQGLALGISENSNVPVDAVVDLVVRMADAIQRAAQVVRPALAGINAVMSADLPGISAFRKKLDEYYKYVNEMVTMYARLGWMLTRENLDMSATMADAADTIAGSIVGVIDAMSVLSEVDFSKIVQGDHLAKQIAVIRNIVRTLVREFAELAMEIDEDLSSAISALASAAGAIAAMIVPTVEAMAFLSDTDFDPILKHGYHLHDQIEIMRNIVRSTMRLFAEAAHEMTTEGITAVSDYASAALTVFGLVAETLEVISSISEYVMPPDLRANLIIFSASMKAVAGELIVALSDLAIRLGEALPIAVTAAEKIRPVLDIVGTALEVLAGIGEYVRIENVLMKVGFFKDDLRYLVFYFADTLKFLGGVLEGELLTDAAAATEKVQPVLDVVGVALEALAGIREYVRIESVLRKVGFFKDDLLRLVFYFGETLRFLGGVLEGELLTAAAEAAEKTQPILDIIGTALEALGGISEYARVEDVLRKVGFFKDDLLRLVFHLSDTLKFLGEALEGKLLTAAAAAAEKVATVIGIVGPAIETLGLLAEYTRGGNLVAKMIAFKSDFLFAVNQLIDAMTWINIYLGREVVTAAAIAESISSVFTSVKAAVDGIDAIATTEIVDTADQMAYLQEQTSAIAATMIESSATVNGTVVQAAQDFATNIGDVVEYVLEALEQLGTLVNADVPGSLQEILDQMVAAVQNTVPSMFDAGAAAGLGLADGIRSQIWNIRAAALEAANEATAIIDSVWRISSPAQAFVERSEMAMAGLVLPFQQPWPLQAAVNTAATSAVVAGGRATSNNYASSFSYGDIHVHVSGSNASAQDIAEAVRSEMDRVGRKGDIFRRTGR